MRSILLAAIAIVASVGVTRAEDPEKRGQDVRPVLASPAHLVSTYFGQVRRIQVEPGSLYFDYWLSIEGRGSDEPILAQLILVDDPSDKSRKNSSFMIGSDLNVQSAPGRTTEVRGIWLEFETWTETGTPSKSRILIVKSIKPFE